MCSCSSGGPLLKEIDAMLSIAIGAILYRGVMASLAQMKLVWPFSYDLIFPQSKIRLELLLVGWFSAILCKLYLGCGVLCIKTPGDQQLLFIFLPAHIDSYTRFKNTEFFFHSDVGCEH